MESIPASRRWVIPLASIIPILACVFAFSLGPSPEKRLEEFYQAAGPEETLTDPLRAAGSEIVPLLLEQVPHKDMPRRRYAIGFLGEGAFPQALEVLRRIVDDESEKDYVRADALVAVKAIKEDVALHAAERYKMRADDLGAAARAMLALGQNPSVQIEGAVVRRPE